MSDGSQEIDVAIRARFVAAKQGDKTAAEVAITEYQRMLLERKLNAITPEMLQKAENTINQIVKRAFHFYSMQAEPVFISCLGELNVDPIVNDDEKNTNEKAFLDAHFVATESAIRTKCMHNNRAKDSVIVIVDLKGASSRLCNTKMIQLLRKMIDIEEKYYPGYVQRVYVINGTKAITMLYKGIKGMFADYLTEKIIWLNPETQVQELAKIVPPNRVPRRAGGKCSCKHCQPGGVLQITN
jgi:hypothetical protein